MSHNGDEVDAVQTAQVKEAALQHVRAAHREVVTANENLYEMMRAAMSFGATWDDLGEAVGGLSRQIAHKRYRRFVE